MGNEAAVLIVALSGRALAASARRGGYVPLVADMFGDVDTLNAAHRHVRLAGGLASGIEERDLIDALQILSEGQEPIGVVYGTGFEDRPQLLQRMAERWRLLGNGADVVAKLKNPKIFSSICSDFGIPTPETSLPEPASRNGWLAKRQGGAGGAHIRPADKSADARGAIYYQRRVSGAPISACFLADGQRAHVLGFSAQWSSPTARQPYRYGGAVRPAPLASTTADKLIAAVRSDRWRDVARRLEQRRLPRRRRTLLVAGSQSAARCDPRHLRNRPTRVSSPNMWRPAPANLSLHQVARRTRRPPASSTPKKTSPLFQYRTGRTGLPICL